jgi:hypothetical protein
MIKFQHQPMISDPRTFEALSSSPTPFIEVRRARLKYSEIGLTFNNVETRMRTPERGRETPQRDIVIARLEEALWFAFADACPELYREYKESRQEGTTSDVADRVTSYIE